METLIDKGGPGRLLRRRRADAPEVPERVRDAIRRQEDATERLISWVQLGVVLTFGALYAVSPKAETAFDPVPAALAIYLALTVVRVAWSHFGRLPPWALALSILIDMALLMVLIWSFHIKYGQPASFYLKAPTLLYVFIFIALRALRFDAFYVVFAGVVAALGWGALILYVVTTDPTNTMITRDYVEYMTSNSILLGAEFDKMISILMVAGIIGVAIMRAKRLLIRSVQDEAAARELSRFFDPEVATRIRTADDSIQAGSGEMRDAAILMLDLRGFTRFASRVTPAEAMQLLAEYQRRMVPVIQANRGSIDKFLGDGILATFGAAQASETYAADALRALEGVMEDAEAWVKECAAEGRACPAVNGAVATGRILFGAVGDESRLEYTVIGDPVNLCAKLEKANPDHGIRAVCDQSALDLAIAQGYAPGAAKRRIGGAAVSGVSEPIDLVVVAE